MTSDEQKVKKCLKDWMDRKKKRKVLEKEVLMPKMKYDDEKSTQPDIFAYKNNTNTIYLIECKKATKLRHVGHAFGQILVTMLTFKKMKKSELEKKLKRIDDNFDINKLRFEFGVAFSSNTICKYPSTKQIVKLLRKLPIFKNFTVYLVDVAKCDVRRLQLGKQMRYDDLHRDHY